MKLLHSPERIKGQPQEIIDYATAYKHTLDCTVICTLFVYIWLWRHTVKHQPIWRVIHGIALSWVVLSAVNCFSCCFVFFQSLRERRTASDQTEAQTTEKTKGKQVEDEDENTSFNLCSSVDLDKVTSVCVYVCTSSCMSVCVCVNRYL